MAQEMTNQEIIKNSKEVKEGDMPWEEVYAYLIEMVKSNKYRILRSGNVLFLIKLLGNDEVQMYVFNADSDKNFYRAFKDFMQAIKKIGFKKLIGETKDLQLLKWIEKHYGNTTIEKLPSEEGLPTLYRGVLNV